MATIARGHVTTEHVTTLVLNTLYYALVLCSVLTPCIEDILTRY